MEDDNYHSNRRHPLSWLRPLGTIPAVGSKFRISAKATTHPESNVSNQDTKKVQTRAPSIHPLKIEQLMNEPTPPQERRSVQLAEHKGVDLRNVDFAEERITTSLSPQNFRNSNTIINQNADSLPTRDKYANPIAIDRPAEQPQLSSVSMAFAESLSMAEMAAIHAHQASLSTSGSSTAGPEPGLMIAVANYITGGFIGDQSMKLELKRRADEIEKLTSTINTQRLQLRNWKIHFDELKRCYHRAHIDIRLLKTGNEQVRAQRDGLQLFSSTTTGSIVQEDGTRVLASDRGKHCDRGVGQNKENDEKLG